MRAAAQNSASYPAEVTEHSRTKGYEAPKNGKKMERHQAIHGQRQLTNAVLNNWGFAIELTNPDLTI